MGGAAPRGTPGAEGLAQGSRSSGRSQAPRGATTQGKQVGQGLSEWVGGLSERVRSLSERVGWAKCFCLQASLAPCVRASLLEFFNTAGLSNAVCRLRPVFQVWRCIAALAAAEAASPEALEQGRRMQVCVWVGLRIEEGWDWQFGGGGLRC